MFHAPIIHYLELQSAVFGKRPKSCNTVSTLLQSSVISRDAYVFAHEVACGVYEAERKIPPLLSVIVRKFDRIRRTVVLFK